MQIISVDYSRLVSFGNYENERLGATAIVPPGEQPEETLLQLKEWVEAHLGQVQQLNQVRAELQGLQWRKSQLAGDIDRAKETYEKIRQALKAHGVDLQEELPF